MKNFDYILYLDMDGVLVDYSSGWWAIAKQLNINPIQVKGKFEYAKEDIARVHTQILQSKFWESLGWEKGGELLWEAANSLFENVHILTSTAAKKDVNKHKIVEAGKLEWIKHNLHPHLLPDRIHVVADGIEKAKFAEKLSILVDDRASTIKAFSAAGGYGILHDANHFKKTIQELVDISRPMNLGEIARGLLSRRQFWSFS